MVTLSNSARVILTDTLTPSRPAIKRLDKPILFI